MQKSLRSDNWKWICRWFVEVYIFFIKLRPVIALALYGGITTLQGTSLPQDVNLYWLSGQTYDRKEEEENITKKSFHVKISWRAPWQRIFWVNQLPLEVIIVTCSGYKRSNRHVDLALIIINYERLSFVIPTQPAHVITVDPFDGRELVPAYDEKRQILYDFSD